MLIFAIFALSKVSRIVHNIAEGFQQSGMHKMWHLSYKCNLQLFSLSNVIMACILYLLALNCSRESPRLLEFQNLLKNEYEEGYQSSTASRYSETRGGL